MDELWLKNYFVVLKSVKVNLFPDQLFSCHVFEEKSWLLTLTRLTYSSIRVCFETIIFLWCLTRHNGFEIISHPYVIVNAVTWFRRRRVNIKINFFPVTPEWKKSWFWYLLGVTDRRRTLSDQNRNNVRQCELIKQINNNTIGTCSCKVLTS